MLNEEKTQHLTKTELNIRKRAKLGIQQDGGHFEHLLKLKAYQSE